MCVPILCKQTNTREPITSYLFKFHANKQHNNEFLCSNSCKQKSPYDNEFHCMQTTSFEPIGSYSIQKKEGKKKKSPFFCYIEHLYYHNQTSKFDNKFQCTPIPRKKSPFESITSVHIKIPCEQTIHQRVSLCSNST